MAALEALFYALSQNSVLRPEGSQRTLFLNARAHEDLKLFNPDEIVLQQYFKPYVEEFEKKGFAAQPELSAQAQDFDAVYLLIPKNQIEAQYYIAYALSCLKTGGLFIAAADNNAGGTRLEKTLQDFGLSEFGVCVKHKARVVWSFANVLDHEVIQNALHKGLEQAVLNGEFLSQPGLFGWDKIDLGSKILLQYLPQDLIGHGADFGCGYGYLSCGLVPQKNITQLSCMDADWRAVQICSKNLSAAKPSFSFQCLWQDLSGVNDALARYDFIVMNPPFHEGRLTDTAIGVRFIQNAAHSLKAGGALWMVANVHLPYEQTLQKYFKTCRKIYEGQGFKILHALR